MAFDTTTPRPRRALLAAALGGLGAWAASAIGRPSDLHATNGDFVIVGDSHEATATTSIYWGGGAAIRGNTLVGVGVYGNATSGAGLHGNATSGVGVEGNATSGVGVQGQSDQSFGVRGESTSGIGVSGSSDSSSGMFGESSSYAGVAGESLLSYGVYGHSSSSIGVQGDSNATNQPGTVGHSAGNSTGVQGYSGAAALPAAKAKTGVYGYAAQDSGSRGVWGRANAGQGVRGEATSGSGLYGQATTGYAIRGNGRLRYDKVSGVAKIAAGGKTKTVAPGVNVTTSSFVLLTPKADIGSRALWFTTDAANDKFTIRMSSTRSSATYVAWLLVG